MSLSQEQRLKLEERLDWLRHDAAFDEHLSLMMHDDVALGDLLNRLPERTVAQIEAGMRNISYKIVEAALQRFEQEKVLITGKGRYVAQCEELVTNSDAFFKNYPREIKQLGVSIFRFTHRVLTDHLGEEKGLRTATLRQPDVVAAVARLLTSIYDLVKDAA